TVLDLYRVVTLRAEHLGEQCRVFGRMADNQFVRRRPVEIILCDERGQDVRLERAYSELREEIARTEVHAVAKEQHRYAGRAGIDPARQHIQIGARALHVVLRLDALERGDLVAQLRGLLELEL